MPPQRGATSHGLARVQEFHTCSDYAPYVHPYAALELQNLFDAGVGLVDQMDGGAWQQLAAMRAGEAVDLVTEVGHALQDPKQTIRNVNAFFTAAAKKRAPDILQRAQALDSTISAGGDEYPSPPRRMGAPAAHRCCLLCCAARRLKRQAFSGR